MYICDITHSKHVSHCCKISNNLALTKINMS